LLADDSGTSSGFSVVSIGVTGSDAVKTRQKHILENVPKFKTPTFHANGAARHKTVYKEITTISTKMGINVLL
jgi:ABC-type Fe3+-citrate transport system substrate-binding protein